MISEEREYPEQELTRRIIGAAMAVHNALGNGLDEKLHERAMCIELAELELDFTQQQEFPVHYKSKFLGCLIPDLIVEGRVIVELKVAEDFAEAHIAQLISYLRLTKITIGLLINFKHGTLRFKRFTIDNPLLNQSVESVESVVKFFHS